MQEQWLDIGVVMRPEELRVLGPSLTVTIRAPGSDVEYDALALIDPGAGMSAIHTKVASWLKCEPLEDAWTVHIADHKPALREVIAPLIRFPKGPEIQFKVAVIEELGDPHEVLIGRDLLRDCRFVMDGITGRFDLHIALHRLRAE